MPNQWSVNSQGCSQSSCGSCPSTCATTARTAVVAMAPIGTSVRVEMNRPMALSPSSEISTCRATSSDRNAAALAPTEAPETSVTGPTPNSAVPITQPAIRIAAGAATQNRAAPTYFTSSRRSRPAGPTSRYRNVPWPASPAIESPATTATVSGRNNGVVITSAVTEANIPFWVTLAKNGGPWPGWGGSAENHTTTASNTGITASAASIAQVRRRRNTSAISEASRDRVCSAGTVEPFPGQGHEELFQARTAHLEILHPHPCMHQGRHHVLRGRRLPVRGGDQFRTGGPGWSGRVWLGGWVRCQPEPGERRRGQVPVRGAQPHTLLTGRAQFGHGALGPEQTEVHHRGVRAYLLNLRQEVGGDENCRSAVGQALDQGAHLPGALRIEAVGGLIEHQQIAGCQQRRRDPQTLLHAQGVCAHLFLRRTRQAYALERFGDATGAGPGGSVRIGRIQAPQIRHAGQERVERRALDQRPLPWQGLLEPGRRVASEYPGIPAGRGRQPEQHADRGRLAG